MSDDGGVRFFFDGRLVGKLGEPWSTGDVPETKLHVTTNDNQDVDA
jgi:hypothetical protein